MLVLLIIALAFTVEHLAMSAGRTAALQATMSKFECQASVIVANRLSMSIWQTANNSLFVDDVLIRVQIENIGRRSEWIYMPGLSLTLIRLFDETRVDGSALPE